MNKRNITRQLIVVAATMLYFAVASLAGAQEPSPASKAPATTTPQSKTFFVRLLPPRATFMTDMTESERKLMEAHFVYWKDQFAKGVCLFGGPVFDPKYPYGVLAIRAKDIDEARVIAEGDPTVKGGVNHIEVAEMRLAFLAGQSTH